MNETKPCAHCGAIFARVAGQSPHNWNRRRFCCQWCASQATAALQRIPREETEKFIALINAGKSQKQAALETGRSQSSLLRAALTYGLITEHVPAPNDPHGVSAREMLAMSRAGLERSDIARKCGVSLRTVADRINRALRDERALGPAMALPPAPPVPETRPPAPTGSAMSWGALNTGVSWERACELVAHLRPH